MCTLCATTGTFDPARHSADPGPTYATLTETADAAAGVTTSYTMAVGDSFVGNLSVAGDVDWVAISLVAGESYQINLSGQHSSLGTLADPYLRLYDANGNQVAFNDDGGPGLESQITFTATTTGTYYIAADEFQSNNTGTYQINVVETVPPTPPGVATLDELADYLTDGFWADFGGGPRAFDTSASNEITVDISALTAEGQQLALWAFEAWELVANLEFTVVTPGPDDDPAMMVFDDNQSGAFAGSSTSGGNILSSNVNISTAWLSTYGTTIDSYSFQTYVHEIGHALGLGHQGNYNGSAIYGIDEDFTNDSWQMSVMSYFSQPENTTTNASYGLLLTTMMADILAIQNLYGAAGSGSATSGNTTWGANTTLGGYLGEVFEAIETGTPTADYTGSAMAYTIFDASGTDTIDLSANTTDDRVDMRAEYFSDIGGLIGNVGIARGTVIENLIAGSGNDTVQGNDANNRIEGRDGDDLLRGGDGSDRLYGGDDNDVLAGNGDDDDLYGEDGADRLIGGNGNDVLRGGDGNDTLEGGDDNDVLAGNDGDDDLYGEDGADRLIGGGDNDVLRGGDGNDTLEGGDENDVLAGNAGDDDLYGENGDDRLIGGNGNDTLRGGENNDTLEGGNDNDVLAGNNGDDDLYGENGTDRLIGGNGNDTLRGGENNDTLEGGNDNDVLAGNNGDDDLQGENGTDRLVGGNGNDTLRGGENNDTLEGGNDNDVLAGNDGDDDLYGENGTDRLVGGAGVDTLTGGSDADVFVFNSVNDSPHGPVTDTIMDFQDGLDLIDLSGFGGLTFVGSSYTGGADEVRYNSAIGRLYIDVDGDGASDFSIDIVGAPTITGADLIL